MLKVMNPATNLKIAELEEDSPEMIAEKYVLARKAQKVWQDQPLQQRKPIIEKFRSLLKSRVDDLAPILTHEMGKPVQQAKNEILGTLSRIDFFLNNIEQTLELHDVTPEKGGKEWITWEPLGVIANISAWNFPYFVGSNVFIPALLTGNAVLYKPSEFASQTGLALVELFKEAGLPEALFTPIIGGAEVGAKLLEENIDGVFFTGSHATGVKISEKVAGKLVRVQLELGGKDPIYVCEDVDIESTAEGLADGAFYNTGQSCCSVERIYVHEKIYDQFVEKFTKTVKSFKMGDPMQEGTYIGPLTRKVHLDFLEELLSDARNKGANVLCGGNRSEGNPGNFFEPTVMTNVNHTMKIMTEETFGPMIGIQKVSSDHEAVEMMNDTIFGLTAGIYTNSAVRAKEVLRQITAGSVYWNCCDRVSPRLPWTGRKQSGIGSTLSHLGIQAFMEPKAWHMVSPN